MQPFSFVLEASGLLGYSSKKRVMEHKEEKKEQRLERKCLGLLNTDSRISGVTLASNASGVKEPVSVCEW